MNIQSPFQLLVGRGKKVKFRGIFRDKFTEKNDQFRGNFAGIFDASFAEKMIGKQRPISWEEMEGGGKFSMKWLL